MQKIVAEALAEGLQRHGISLIFSQCFPVRMQHVAPRYGIRQIGFRTENAGGVMADGYARVSHQISVVAGQSGPAATLLVAPLAEALKASIPMLAIIEESPTGESHKNAFQEFDHLKLFSSCAKEVWRVETGERIDDYLDMSIALATSGRPGPVVMIVPMDVLSQPAATEARRTMTLGHYPLDRTIPEQGRITEAAALIAAAKKPLIIAGGGVHLSDAAGEVAALSDLASVPVATTNMGKGVTDETAPLSLGLFGSCMAAGARSHEVRSFATEADLVFFIGSRTNANGTDNWRLFPESARFIHLDVDGLEVGRNYESFRLVGDAKATLAALIGELEKLDLAGRQQDRERITAAIANSRSASDQFLDGIGRGSTGAIRPEFLVRELDKALTPGDIVTADASFASNWVTSFITSRSVGTRIITPRGMAGLGWGFPLALGAKLARPEATVFCLVGDGGFAHCWSELETAKRSNIPVVVIVLNNQILGYQRQGEEWVFGTHSDAADLGPVDHAAIARACGCHGEKVEEPEQFAPALARAVASGMPAVIDAYVDLEALPPLSLFEMKPAGSANIAV